MKAFLWAFILYSIFVIYGSLVPLKFNYLSLSDAWRIFLSLKFRPLEQISRIDWYTNILLGLPTSFFAMGFFYEQNRWPWTILIPVLIFAFCFCLAGVAEFLQLFFSSRYPSMNDIAAQAIGAIIGIFFGLIFGAPLRNAISEFMITNFLSKKINFLFCAYSLFLLLYNIMPLDLSINPSDIYHKWKIGHINLIPFAFVVKSFSMLVYNISIDIIKWAPISFFLIYFKGVRKLFAIVYTLSFAILIEFLQLFVISRITDITDVVTALIGGGIGILATKTVKNRKQIHSGREKILPLKLGSEIIILLCWMLVIMFLYWFPFNFVFDKNSIKLQLKSLSIIPFVNYQVNDIYSAITTAFRKIILFIPSGFILSYVIKDGSLYSKSVNTMIILAYSVLITGCSVIVEIGQFFLPGKVPDITDIMLEMFGAVAGYWTLRQLYMFRQK